MDSYFVAIAPDLEAKQVIPAFTNLNNLHITLTYLGSKTPMELEAVKKQLYEISMSTSTFNVSGNKFSTFDQGRYPHLMIEKTNNLVTLKNRLNKTLDASLQFKDFKPHITISNSNIGFIPESIDMAFEAKSIVLYRSRGYDKPYEPVASFPLKSRNALQKAIDWVKEIF
jgi:2'-5' RNA ligase